MTKPIATIAALDMPSRASRRVVFAAALTVIAAGLTAVTLSGLVPAAFSGQGERGVGPSLGQMRLAATSACFQCGTIEVIEPLGAAGRDGLGAIAGGLAGVAAGSRLGGDQGVILLTMFGAAGGSRGAFLPVNAAPGAWLILVRMEDGSLRRVEQQQAPSLTVGDRVRLVRGNVVART